MICPMADQHSLPLYEKVWLKRTFQRVMDTFIFLLLLLLLLNRVFSFNYYSFPWFVAFLCESWFTYTWFVILSTKWSPAVTKTFLDSLLHRVGELPAVDLFVTTADPVLEPPIITVNTVLSLLALDYPAHKLACYVSDDGCSPFTFYALVEACKFAKLWVPFCKKHNVQFRAPFRYFSVNEAAPANKEFRQEWLRMKDEYEELSRKVEDAGRKSSLFKLEGEFAVFSSTERRNHEAIIKVIWKNKEGLSDGLPHLVYISREKRAEHPHQYKAGAMNVLTRVSGLMTNAPFMLNVDCDMLVNNPKIVLHTMCIFLDSKGHKEVAFVQCPQQFYDGLKDDPFGNQWVAAFAYIVAGMGGLQGPYYAGTNCFHRRKVIYGLSPNDINANGNQEKLSEKELEQKFGSSKEFVKLAAQALEEKTYSPNDVISPSKFLEAATQVARCGYEYGTGWGKQVGWLYGSLSEDVLTGLSIHRRGWRSEFCTPEPIAFTGCAPGGCLSTMTQQKRWASGLLVVLFSNQSPILGTLFGKIQFRECLSYLWITNWGLRSVPELCYAALPAYCIITNSSIFPKELGLWIPVSLFVIYNVYSLLEYLAIGLSIREWWNNQTMGRTTTMNPWFLGFLSAIIKLLGISETVFEITQKEPPTSGDDGGADANAGRFTFDESPVFVPGTTMLLVQLTALVMKLLRLQPPPAQSGNGCGLGELFCSAYVVACYWPFLKGLFGKGEYGIPSSTVLKSATLAFLFVQFCRSNITGSSSMADSTSLPLFERIPINVSKQRIVNTIILFLHLSFLAYRLLSLNSHGFPWLLAFFCEFWFTIHWVFSLCTMWNPVDYKTYPQRLLQRVSELPQVDMFVATADPELEPPILTMNTVLSLLAVDYPTHKLACYVSDDGCSPLTYYALVEASKFATLWVPFCKNHNIQLRAPFRYFSSEQGVSAPNVPLEFQKEWIKIKDEYDQLCGKIENAAQKMVSADLSADFKDTERNNHSSIIKVIWENKEGDSRGLPHLIYIAREKRPHTPHHYKAGAMNVLTRVSGVMTNAPYMLNVDCDMYSNNPQVVLHAMCLLLGLKENKHQYAYAQFPQLFYGELKDDPFGNQVVVAMETIVRGMAGIQGPFYMGTGCFHRRKVIYGLSPHGTETEGNLTNEALLKEEFGDSEEFIKSVADTFSCVEENKDCPPDLWSCMEGANTVSGCAYEHNTSWGNKVGWQYGSSSEDVLTGMKIQARGWKSAFMMPHPPAFLGSSPSSVPVSLIQKKRWATGLLEILFSKHNPIFYSLSSKLHFRQCLAYLWHPISWPLLSFPHLCYAVLPAYCILTNTSFLPKIHEPALMVPIALFLLHNLREQVLYFQHGLSIRAWWNNTRMEKITYTSARLLGVVAVILKLLGLSETVFEVTQKHQSSGDDEKNKSEAGRFTFDESSMFVLPTTILLMQLTALVMNLVGLQPPEYNGGDDSGTGEVLSSIWQVLCFWPFVKGLFGKGKYGIPFSTLCKSAGLALLFVYLSRKSFNGLI